MQLTKVIFSHSAIVIEKKTIENRLWAKSEFFWAKKMHHGVGSVAAEPLGIVPNTRQIGRQQKV